MLAGQNVGRRHERALRSGLYGCGESEQGHYGLARADVALEKAHHAVAGSEVAGDLGDGGTLRGGQREREASDDRIAQPCFGGERTALRLAKMAAHQDQGQLVGEKLVVGEAGARQRFDARLVRRGGLMDLAQGGSEGRPATAGEECRLDPFGKIRKAGHSTLHGGVHDTQGQAGGQRIDGLDERHPLEFLGRNHMIGMHDLGRALVPGDGARDETALAHRQQAREVVGEGVEVDEGELARIIEGLDTVREALHAPRRRAVRADGDLDGHDPVRRQVRHGRPLATIDEAGRQVKQQVDDAQGQALAVDRRTQESFQDLLDLGADSLDGGGVGKQWIEQGWPHGRRDPRL